MATRKKILVALIAAAALAVAAFSAFFLLRTQSHDPTAPGIPVLAYHSVMPDAYYYPINANNPWILHIDTFYSQMRYLYENNFNTVTSCQLINFLFYDEPLPENPVIITFDDGALDNALFAAPILRQFGFTAMQFLITGYIPETSQAMTAYPLQYMSFAEIADTADVFEFGSHSHNMHHTIGGVPPLVSESADVIKADLLQSFDFPLTFTTGFAFPFGRYSSNALQALQAAGVRFAFTTHEGYLTPATNPMLIPRFTVSGGPQGWTTEHFSNIVHGR